MEQRFRTLIEQGQRAGEIDAGVDPLQPGRVLFGLLLGLWVLVRSGTSGEPALCAAAQQVQSLLATSLPSPCTTSP